MITELAQFKYYWRIEPGMLCFSDINFDVFKCLAGKEKVYVFTIAMYDSPQSVRTLFLETINFLNKDNNQRYVTRTMPSNGLLRARKTCAIARSLVDSRHAISGPTLRSLICTFSAVRHTPDGSIILTLPVSFTMKNGVKRPYARWD